MRALSSIRLILALVAALFLGASAAQAAPPITSGQWASFRAHVKAQPQGSSIYTAYHKDNGPGNGQGDPDALVALYNATSGTSIWRTDVKPAELVANIIVSEFIALAVNGDQKRSAMLMLVQLGAGGLDASNANVRTSFQTIWTGTTTLNNLVAVGQRAATAFEAITAFLTAAAPANVCAPEIYGHVLTRFEVSTALWDANGTPL